MKTFEYKAFDSSGAKVSGQIEAIDQLQVQKALAEQGVFPSEIKEYRQKQSIFTLNQKVSLSDLEFLTAELSLLLESGVRIDKGIEIIKRTKAKPALAKMLGDISRTLKKGSSLSKACAEHPEVFDSLYINLIELGEASGDLPQVFAGLARDLRFRRDLQRKIIQSLTYPMVIFGVCILSIFFIFNFIVPQMSSLFADAADLPWYTSVMLNASAWMQDYQWFLVAFLVLLGVIIGSMWQRPEFQALLQRALINTPGIKGILFTTERIRFASGLTLMLKAGLQIDKGISLATGSLKNESIRREMNIVRNKVSKGSALTPALRQSALFPDYYVSLLEVGEESGKLAEIFDEIANRSRQDFEEWTQKMTTLIEPLMILLMGGIVGGVVVVMLMSMVSVNDIGF